MSNAHVWSTPILDKSLAPTLQRRMPRQQRSRDRFKKIVDVARKLIADRGNDAVSMREIALAADIPIASVYQYFPDKNGLLWTLIADVFETLETKWNADLKTVDSVVALNRAALALFDELVVQCEADICFSRLWISVQANAVLAELDHAFNIRIADTYADKLCELDEDANRDDAWHRTLLMATLSSTALQLAFQMEANRKAILDEFRMVLKQQLER